MDNRVGQTSRLTGYGPGNHEATIPAYKTPFRDFRSDDDRRPEPFAGSNKYLAVVAALLVAACSVTRYALIVWLSTEQLVGHIPDDAFYELQIARHFLATRQWTFDSGFSTTSGFHLLNVYLMAIFPWTLEDPSTALRLWMGIDLILWIVTIFIVCRLVADRFGALALLPAVFILTGRSLMDSSTDLLEFPFVMLLAALYVRAWLSDRPASRLGLFLLGMLGSLARSDFGGLPLAFFAADTIQLLRGRSSDDHMSRSVWGLGGAIFGLALGFAHSFFLSGHFLSGSVMAKALWGQRAGYSLVGPLNILTATFASSALELFLLATIFALGAIVYAMSAPSKSGETSNGDLSTCVIGSIIALIVYLLAYGFDPAVQIWYGANFSLPLILLLAATARSAIDRPVLRGALIAGLAVGLPLHLSNVFAPIWENRGHSMYRMAQYLKQNPPAGRIGAWNAGLPGYLLDGKIINLDGLMNDQIYREMRDRTIEKYLDRSRIEYLVDFPEQFENPGLANMLGYDPKRLKDRLLVIRIEKGASRGSPWRDYSLFKLKNRGSSSEAEKSP